MILKEGKQVVIHDKSFDVTHGPFDVLTDTEVKENTLMLIESTLYCTDTYSCVKELDEQTYKINVYIQDALVATNGNFYQGIAETY